VNFCQRSPITSAKATDGVDLLMSAQGEEIGAENSTIARPLMHRFEESLRNAARQ
jgi:hypothetical protein